MSRSRSWSHACTAALASFAGSLLFAGCNPVTFNELLGNGKQAGYAVEQTADGGYVVAGDDNSSNVPQQPFAWVVKTDAAGNEQWEKSWPGEGLTQLYHVHQTSDGDYVVAGFTAESISTLYFGYLAKLDGAGNLLWEKKFGTAGEYSFGAADATAGGGTILIGTAGPSKSGPFSPYLVKADPDGNLEWERTLAQTGASSGQSVWQLEDGGFILGFGNGSNAKTDALGNIEWQTASPADEVSGPRPTSDGGFLLTGWVGTWPNQNAALAKLDSEGQRVWTVGLGGSKADTSTIGQETRDGGYVIAGDTYSYGAGANDLYVVKADSSGALEWQATFGGTGYDLATDVDQTSDGGYVVLGRISGGSFGTTGVYTELVKTDADGNAPSTP